MDNQLSIQNDPHSTPITTQGGRFLCANKNNADGRYLIARSTLRRRYKEFTEESWSNAKTWMWAVNRLRGAGHEP